VELFREIEINWLSKKYWFFGFSWLLIALGVIGYMVNGGLALGIDFTGGTVIQIKFNQQADHGLLRDALRTEAFSAPLIQTYGPAAENTVQVRMQTTEGENQELEIGHRGLIELLRKSFDPEVRRDLVDFNNTGMDAIYRHLSESDPDNVRLKGMSVLEADAYYTTIAQQLLDYRNRDHGGLVPEMNDLRNVAGISESVMESLENRFYAGSFAIKGIESVGAVVGEDLRRRAALAVGASLLGMLVYIGIRFKPVYGIAAVIALFHDLAITIGFFALTNKEISLTVIAAFLTLIGYSMNDSIVVFDRVRENLRVMRKESITKVLNFSLNKVFTRTLMTSGTTFLAVFTLFILGGEVLNGFAFALTIGILIGTYSSIGIASPIVEWWYASTGRKAKRKTA
jgi:preprotein translocase subunit SecF